MAKKDIDIYEILKGMPYGTPLYTPMCGNVELTSVEEDKEKLRAIWTENKYGGYSFDKHGKWTKGGEVLLFPSKEMRDWSKFFKKGDVLVSNDSESHIIFKGFSKDDYTIFEGKHWISVSKKRYISRLDMQNTQDYHIEDDKDAVQTYINTIEERLGGKLNLETLEIEQPKPEFKDGDIVVLDGDSKSHYKTILLYQTNIDDEYEVYSFLNTGTSYLGLEATLMDDRKARLATDSEKQQLFDALAKVGKRWNPDTKTIEDLPKKCEFKPYDKVLVRNEERSKWQPAFFVRDRGEETIFKYKVLSIQSGRVEGFLHCIPFDGNEDIAFTDYEEDLPF